MKILDSRSLLSHGQISQVSLSLSAVFSREDVIKSLICLVIGSILLLTCLSPLYADENIRIPVLEIKLDKKPGYEFKDLHKGLVWQSDLHSDLPQSYFPKKKRNIIKEYLSRAQFVTLDKITAQLCRENIDDLKKDRNFYAKFPVKNLQDAAFYAGLHYYNHWTSFSFANIFSFDLPYKTVYNAEQHFKYYLSKYPEGKYVLPTMFSIAKCRAHQKDYLEAYYTYKYAVEFAMQNEDVEDEQIADKVALELVRLSRKHGGDFGISFRIKKNYKIFSPLEIIFKDNIVYITVFSIDNYGLHG